jgi:cyclophilin family peptidyl-prolyl cis-trans isomerase
MKSLLIAVAAALAVLVLAVPTAPGAAGCRDVKQPRAKPDGQLKAPKGRLDAGRTWDAVVQTSCGTFTIRLAPRTSPRTAASFVFLARRGFFNGTVFHRIVPGFVIQGGDPTATGTGGPGYEVRDTPPRSTRYTFGTVAMAKTPDAAAGTSGSQFFVVTASPSVALPPDYAVLGHVVAGKAAVRRIGALGDQNEQPTQPIVVDRVTIRSR